MATKTNGKSKSSKSSKSSKPAKPVAAAEKTGTRDAWSRPYTASAHYVCVACIDKADGASKHDLAMLAGKLSLAAGIEWRGAVGTQLSHMKRQKLITNEAKSGLWTVTAHGKKLWGRDGKTHRTRAEIDQLAKTVK